MGPVPSVSHQWLAGPGDRRHIRDSRLRSAHLLPPAPAAHPAAAAGWERGTQTTMPRASAWPRLRTPTPPRAQSRQPLIGGCGFRSLDGRVLDPGGCVGDRAAPAGMGEARTGTGAPADGLAPAGLPMPEAGVEAEVAKLLPFLAPGARADLQAEAVRHVLALTGSGPGRALLAGQAALLRALVELAATPAPAPAPARDAARALVNLAAEAGLHERLLEAEPALPARLLGRALDPAWPWAEEAAAALANLSREPAPCAALMAALEAEEPGESGLERLVRALCTPDYNARAPLHYLGPVLSNLSQRPAARAFLLDRER